MTAGPEASVVNLAVPVASRCAGGVCTEPGAFAFATLVPRCVSALAVVGDQSDCYSHQHAMHNYRRLQKILMNHPSFRSYVSEGWSAWIW